MSAYLIAERYAKALNAAIANDTALDEAQQSLGDLARVVLDHHDFRTLVTNPAITLERRGAALDEVLRRMSVPDTVASLVRVMLWRGRIVELPRVSAYFHELVDARLNRVGAEVVTAVPLKADEEASLRKSLTAYAGRDIRMTTQIDPAIVGGVVARIGDTVIDGSLRTRLARLRQRIVSEFTA